MCLFLVLVMVIATLGNRTFHQHRVLRITVNEREHLDFLNTLFYTNNTLDFWTEPRSLPSFVDVRVTPEQISWFEEELSKRGLSYRVLIDNVQELIERQLTRSPNDDFYSHYHTYDEVRSWIINLPFQYPHLATVVPISQSYENRQLLAVKVTSLKSSNKPAIWFDGGIHAREWISVAATVYILGNMLNDYNNDTTITLLLDNLEIWVLPMFNPDGYAYTFSDDRMWRKTRSPNAGITCIGTDPNRNWDYEWGGEGVSTDPCNEAYLGPEAFSEVEVKTVGMYLKNSTGQFRGYINFHSYGQLWMSPWGYTEDLPKDYQIQNTLSGRCSAAIAAVYGTEYQYGPIATTIYPASGSSADYTYGVANIVYSYGVELRDTGDYGFLLPEDQIVPSGIETYAAIKVWALQCLQKL